MACALVQVQALTARACGSASEIYAAIVMDRQSRAKRTSAAAPEAQRSVERAHSTAHAFSTSSRLQHSDPLAHAPGSDVAVEDAYEGESLSRCLCCQQV